jgi:hypothetical protein
MIRFLADALVDLAALALFGGTLFALAALITGAA